MSEPEPEILMDKNILDEQINYYRARAPEYDESISQLEDAVQEAP
jgi:hypothetical protein